MPDGHLYDKDLVEEANKNDSYEPEDLYRGSILDIRASTSLF